MGLKLLLCPPAFWMEPWERPWGSPRLVLQLSPQGPARLEETWAEGHAPPARGKLVTHGKAEADSAKPQAVEK